ncbi:MAG: gamma-aminobutyrate dehydratase [Acidobacteria bacterium]|nr:gamma-aminobutyrate dehydratase [Acidobacteriota bacterium]
MPLMTAEQYVESLRDGRNIWYRGERVNDVTTHPVIGLAVEHAAIDYRMAEDAAERELAVVDGPKGPYSRYYEIPRTPDDLLRRSALIERATALGGTLVVLIKEIGTDALFALHLIAGHMDRTLGTHYLPRVEAFHAHCRDRDLAVAVAQTDVKGNRAGGPTAQVHPDYYVRVVAKDNDGITLRGAKVHTSVSTNAHEIIVLPTRNLAEGEESYAVACAVPANAPGLTMLASGYGRRGNAFEQPLSARHKMMETLTVFDDVKVPWNRVFLNGEVAMAGPLAKTFVEFHRFTAVSYKLPLVDLFVGASHLMAEYNGVLKAGHVRDKLARLISYAQICRGMTREAAREASVVDGVAVPDAELINIAKLYFATNYHQALAWVQDIAGGLLVTGPSAEDLDDATLRPLVDRYLGAANPNAEERLRLINLIADLTASDFAGYQSTLAIHAEGSIEAEKMTIWRQHDIEPDVAYARRLAGITKVE